MRKTSQAREKNLVRRERNRNSDIWRKTAKLDLSLRRAFHWPFVTADVSTPILGADFLSHFGLLVDIRDACLRDTITQLQVNGTACSRVPSSVHTILPQHLRWLENLPPPDDKHRKHNTQHHIETTGSPISARTRRLPADKLAAAKLEFQHMVELGICRPSKSQWSSPLHMVPKRVPCGDFRAANRYPVPNLHDFNPELSDKTFSKMDLICAFHQIPVASEDIEKTAVITPFGLYEFLMLPFGLRNAAQDFQRFIYEITRDMPFVFAYIDDILVTSSNEVEHNTYLRTIFTRLREYNIQVNFFSVFAATEVPFLSYMVSIEGIQPLEERVKLIRDFDDSSE
ncbi:hypothetical protein Trydic_g16937 [Trypoxylus dichotomus]